MGIHWQFGVVQNASGAAAFAAEADFLNEIADYDEVGGSGSSVVTFTTSSGDIVLPVTASGGSGSYTYSWAISKLSEVSDTGTRFSVAATGATNTATLQPTFNGARGPNSGDFMMGRWEMTCTVSDGVASNIVVTFGVTINGITL